MTVKFRKLVWHQMFSRREYPIEADTGFKSRYTVEEDLEGYLHLELNDETIGRYVNMNDAKRAAQRDFERRVSGGHPDPWDQTKGMAPDATGDLSSEEFVRKQRDEEWGGTEQ